MVLQCYDITSGQFGLGCVLGFGAQARSDMTANYKPQQQIGDTTLIAKKQEQRLTMTKLRRQKIKRQNSSQ